MDQSDCRAPEQAFLSLARTGESNFVEFCEKIMAFNDLERKRIENTVGAFVEKLRPPPHIRPKLDFGFRVIGQSIELFEIRQQWDQPKIRHEYPFAKSTFV